MILAFHKPYGVLSQFTQEAPGQRTLAEFHFPPGVYPVGRLDSDSEGLLLLSDEREIIDRLLNPRYGHERTYWVQVDGIPTEQALDKLRLGGLPIQGYTTLPCSVRLLDTPPWTRERIPPIRYRAHIPTSWLELKLTEGKNRQVRRMTAAAGAPTLRLLRAAIGRYEIGPLAEGEWKELSPADKRLLLDGPPAQNQKYTSRPERTTYKPRSGPSRTWRNRDS